jgi:hypothetical protein
VGTRKGQEPLDGFGAVHSGLGDEAQGLAHTRRVVSGLVERAQRDVAVAGDEGEVLVQVVGGATRHLAQGAQLLGAREGGGLNGHLGVGPGVVEHRPRVAG